MTLAERLLAGEHAGCATWTDVAARFGCGDSALRKARHKLKAQGRAVDLMPNSGNAIPTVGRNAFITKGDKPAEAHETKPTVQVCAGCSDCAMGGSGSNCKPGNYPRPADPDLHAYTVDTANKLLESRKESSRWPSVEAFDRDERMVVTAESTLYDADGNVKLVWQKTKVENDERRDWLEAIRDMGGELPRYTPSAPPLVSADDLLVVAPVGDPHVGLLSWREDAGENFDLEIAERRLMGAFDHLLGLAPPAKECLVILIGDTAHADGQSNTTTKGTRVDVDGRIIKVARTILRICRHAIGLALQRHERVTMIVERGNHDELVSAMIALALAQHYEHEPRVTIDQSPAMFHWFKWGGVIIGTHHGDKVKPMDLLGVMAVDKADEWSQCKHRRFYLGHYHHQIVKEVPGLICEYLPTLASSDAWHHSMGYRSSKAMYIDVYHREHGHVDRHIVGLSQLRAA